MLKIVFLFAILALTVTLASDASAQEMKNSTFSENIVVVYNHELIRGDGAIKMVKQSGDIELSVGLQSTSNDDFKFSEQFIEKIKEGEFVHSIVIHIHLEIFFHCHYFKPTKRKVKVLFQAIQIFYLPVDLKNQKYC